MSDKPNVLKEAILRSAGESLWNETVEKARGHPFYEAILREGITGDIAGALGKMQDVVVEAAQPVLIGREMITVLNVNDAIIRFPKAKLAIAYETAEGALYWLTGEKYETQDIKCDIEIKAGCEWSKRFYEDATWPVLERQAKELGRAIGELETAKIFALYDGIAAGDLAGGAIQATNDGANFAWADVVKLQTVVSKENFNPTVMALNPAELEGLYQQNQFIQSLYYAPETVIRTGKLPTMLGLTFVVSTKITAATKLCIDKDVGAVMLIRRDLITEPFENPKDDRYGVVASERIGLGVLRSKAVGKGT